MSRFLIALHLLWQGGIDESSSRCPRAGNLADGVDGQGAGTGLNVYGLPPYGEVTTDLLQKPRPPAGSWDRGAYGL